MITRIAPLKRILAGIFLPFLVTGRSLFSGSTPGPGAKPQNGLSITLKESYQGVRMETWRAYRSPMTTNMSRWEAGIKNRSVVEQSVDGRMFF